MFSHLNYKTWLYVLKLFKNINTDSVKILDFMNTKENTLSSSCRLKKVTFSSSNQIVYYFDCCLPFTPFLHPSSSDWFLVSNVEKILIMKELAESGQEQWSLLVGDHVQLIFCSLHFPTFLI